MEMFYGKDSITGGDNEDLYERCRAADDSTMLWNAAARPDLQDLGYLSSDALGKPAPTLCTRQGVVGAIPDRNTSCSCGILPVDKIISTHDLSYGGTIAFYVTVSNITWT